MSPNIQLPTNSSNRTNPLPLTLASQRETMYHGTSMQGADCILRHGFQTSQGGLLGAGVYLTTDKSKAALYGPRVLTCSVDVGNKCRIARRNHPKRFLWPASCNTKWIPAEAACKFGTSQKGDVHCVQEKNRISIIDVQDVRCCPCSIADCRQCFPDLAQQKAQRRHLSQTGNFTDQSCIVCHAPSLMMELMAEINGSCQLTVEANSCSAGWASEDVEGQMDGSSTASGSVTSDGEECYLSVGKASSTASRTSDDESNISLIKAVDDDGISCITAVIGWVLQQLTYTSA